MSSPFVLAAGGTGGHLFPAEALALELLEGGRQVVLVTDARTEGLAGVGIDTRRIRAGRFDRGTARAPQAFAELAAGVLQARRLLRRLAPAGVIGFGGYPSVPTVLAANSLRLPILIHEQNAVIGRANRLLAPRARRIATGFPGTRGLRPADLVRAAHTGNPVRAAVLAASARDYQPPRPRAQIELLVLGGSQGAHILGETVPAALAALPEPLRRVLKVSQQARPEDREAAASTYAAAGIAAETESFFADVPERLARAQLVICRAGASTVAELAAIGRPAVLIPYPHAADDHQTANARSFAASGGGWVVAQDELRADTLAARLQSLLADPSGLNEASRSARGFGRRDAAQQLARLALALENRDMARERAA
jgi:UDP-N-acetylglucosamine--N-acetylmuramyl-(pentapeptide) pyrophosphoryl-undecaprenol N-acetylglucosamine transferase